MKKEIDFIQSLGRYEKIESLNVEAGLESNHSNYNLQNNDVLYTFGGTRRTGHHGYYLYSGAFFSLDITRFRGKSNIQEVLYQEGIHSFTRNERYNYYVYDGSQPIRVYECLRLMPER